MVMSSNINLLISWKTSLSSDLLVCKTKIMKDLTFQVFVRIKQKSYLVLKMCQRPLSCRLQM